MIRVIISESNITLENSEYRVSSLRCGAVKATVLRTEIIQRSLFPYRYIVVFTDKRGVARYRVTIAVNRPVLGVEAKPETQTIRWTRAELKDGVVNCGVRASGERKGLMAVVKGGRRKSTRIVAALPAGRDTAVRRRGSKGRQANGSRRYESEANGGVSTISSLSIGTPKSAGYTCTYDTLDHGVEALLSARRRSRFNRTSSLRRCGRTSALSTLTVRNGARVCLICQGTFIGLPTKGNLLQNCTDQPI